MVKIKNSTKKDLFIAVGSRIEDAYVGILKADETENLELHDDSFINILDATD